MDKANARDYDDKGIVDSFIRGSERRGKRENEQLSSFTNTKGDTCQC